MGRGITDGHPPFFSQQMDQVALSYKLHKDIDQRHRFDFYFICIE
jgi:hypothetical protein